jgi:hypothetical protein
MNSYNVNASIKLFEMMYLIYVILININKYKKIRVSIKCKTRKRLSQIFFCQNHK